MGAGKLLHDLIHAHLCGDSDMIESLWRRWDADPTQYSFDWFTKRLTAALTFLERNDFTNHRAEFSVEAPCYVGREKGTYHGVIDCILYDQHHDEWSIVEWKSGRKTEDPAHIEQVQKYGQLLQHTYDNVRNLRLFIVYLADHGVVEVDPMVHIAISEEPKTGAVFTLWKRSKILRHTYRPTG